MRRMTPRMHSGACVRSPTLLHLGEKGAHRFLPMRFLFAWIDGVHFTRQGGRGVGIRDQYAALAEPGLARVSESSPFFDRFWDRYHGRCVEMGNAPACHIGDDPRTGRVFWTTPS